MIQLADNLWIGSSNDVKDGKYVGASIRGFLSVAPDLRGRYGWPTIEHAQVGLVDGPGNEVSDYCAAVLELGALIRRQERVLVYDHDGGRALAVAMMYLCLRRGRRPAGGSHSNNMHCWCPWDDLSHELAAAVDDLPAVHTAHKEAYEVMPFSVLEMLL
jgi:hypothetical protein